MLQGKNIPVYARKGNLFCHAVLHIFQSARERQGEHLPIELYAVPATEHGAHNALEEPRHQLGTYSIWYTEHLSIGLYEVPAPEHGTHDALEEPGHQLGTVHKWYTEHLHIGLYAVPAPEHGANDGLEKPGHQLGTYMVH